MTKLQREHVEAALEEIGDPSKIPSRHRAKKYCLVTRSNHWAPKYVVGLAWKYAIGTEKPYTKFSGGEAGANAELKRLDYEVLPCSAAHWH